MASFSPRCRSRKRKPACSLAGFENGGVFTSPCIHTSGLSSRPIEQINYMSKLTYCKRWGPPCTRAFCRQFCKKGNGAPDRMGLPTVGLSSLRSSVRTCDPCLRRIVVTAVRSPISVTAMSLSTPHCCCRQHKVFNFRLRRRITPDTRNVDRCRRTGKIDRVLQNG